MTVLAFPLTLNVVDGKSITSVGSASTWTASTQLAAMRAPASERRIFVGNAGAGSSAVATEFTWAGISGNASLKTNLDRLSPTSSADGLAQYRLNYLRGDKSKEGNPFRIRSKLLGDIVNSSVTYSGTPQNIGAFSNSFQQFAASVQNRTAAVFVGANDGMLHAFKATTGDELFAYIPSWMGPKLSILTDPSYIRNHQSYVDGSPVIAEAQLAFDGNANDWKTVLVAGTGAGGSGVFALDVTNPSTFSASNAMWEFTRDDDPDMGYVVGQAKIMKLRTSAPNATPTYRWFAMVASGVNNYTGSNSAGNFGSGYPALFLLALDKPAGTAWTSTGNSPNYYKISLPVNGKVDLTTPLTTTSATGLINFRATYGLNTELSQVFMGDLLGQVFKLDFSSHGSTEWNINKLSSYNKGTTAAPLPYPLYTAVSSSGKVQPITMAPTVVSGPTVAGIDTSYIAFGTGKYLEASDKTSTDSNSFYVIYDNGSTKADSSSPVGSSVVSGRGRLAAATATSATSTSAPGTISIGSFVWGRASSDTDKTQRSGWYFDLPATGERQVNSAIVAGDYLVFGSLIPAASGSLGSCAASGGSGNNYTINVDTGVGSSTVSVVGIPSVPILLDAGDASYGTTFSTGRRIKTIFPKVADSGSMGIDAGRNITPTQIASGRLSWRQINNYQDLKNKP